jgi:signal transduction histidine kinase
MLRNLVANAIKYRRTDRRLRVEIAAAPRPPRPPEPFDHIPERVSRASVRGPRNRGAQREPVPRDAPLIEIVVTDNGVGMTGEAAAHAFDPFYRASATRGIPGNGLGLAIVKRTLEAMGGGCDLVSAPDQGTRVTLHVPAAP